MKKNMPHGKLIQHFHPGWVVNLCFVVIWVCSMILTWREMVLLEDTYSTSQQNTLANVSNALDMQMQAGVNQLLFFRNAMQASIQNPLELKVLRDSTTEFERKRAMPQWKITLHNRRTLPVFGVSDDFIAQSSLLNRDIALLHDEFTASMELGYLFSLSANASMLPRRAYYVSRAGFFVSTWTDITPQEIAGYYYHLLLRPWFIGQRERENPARGVRWFTDQAWREKIHDSFITASVPLDYQRYWYGVLVMSFPISAINALMDEAQRGQGRGEYQLYDASFKMLISTLSKSDGKYTFSRDELARLQGAMARDTVGGLRLGTHFVSWQKLKHFDGSLLRIHALSDGIHGNFGRITVALALMLLLFMTMFLIAWWVIRRMVKNMYSMQSTLQWQAWYDPLTRLYNRGALFERANMLLSESQRKQCPFSVIQIDLDHFKNINDRFGHQAGDRVLSHAAGLISSAIGPHDIAGRVGGEEFCILLPDSTLAQAAAVAERICTRISGKEMLIQKNTTIRISASLGVSGALESDSWDFGVLQSIADRRLYRAKNNGRNQVCASDETPNS